MNPGVFFLIILAIAFFIVMLTRKADIPDRVKAKNLGMNPENTFGIRTRPERFSKYANNSYALVEFMDNGNVRFYLPPHKELFVAPKSTILAFGMSSGVFGQIQLYIDQNHVNNPNNYIPVAHLLSGVITTPGTLFNRRNQLSSSVKSIAQRHNIPIVPLQYPSDLKNSAVKRIVVLIIVSYFLLYPLFTS